MFAPANAQTKVQGYMDHEESGKCDNTKETNTAPGTSLIEVEIYNLPDKEFKIIFVKTVNEMQANTDN